MPAELIPDGIRLLGPDHPGTPVSRERPAPDPGTARPAPTAGSAGPEGAGWEGQMTPWASIASATRSKPAMFAPVT
ncbi:hypothetical protein GCM10010302_40910 [Streptomyces polychromogenes]|uniref:Uncharacterized protein n=1 Tax=Streptomyces polychromogenes TaxID=67342 RepID=A0ABN0VGR3_9ACTN